MEEPVTRLGPGLKTTYSAEPEQNFLSYASQPRTRQEAVNRGYEKMSPEEWSCEDRFLGHAYADPDEPSIAILYDAAARRLHRRGSVHRPQICVRRRFLVYVRLENCSGFPSRTARCWWLGSRQPHRRRTMCSWRSLTTGITATVASKHSPIGQYQLTRSTAAMSWIMFSFDILHQYLP